MSAIREESLKLDPSPIVHLFTLDATSVGASVYNFCSSAYEVTAASFGGTVYLPLPCKLSGISKTASGQFPRPVLEISAILLDLVGLANQYDDLLGAKLTRLKTFRRFLDGQPQADSSQFFPPDVFLINRRSQSSRDVISFELASAIDVNGVQIPNRLASRSTCGWRYRIWAGSAFTQDELEEGGCPYKGAAMFDKNGIAVSDPTKDVCGKRLKDCKSRFGANAELPYGGFPGLRRL